MINNFSGIVQQDFLTIYDKVRGNLPKNNENDAKVRDAAIRILCTGIMAVAAISTIGAVVTFPVAPIGALFSAMVSIASFVLAHDVFVIVNNLGKDDVLEKAASIFSVLKDAWKKQEIPESFDAAKAANGTILNVLWQRLLSQKIQLV